MHELVEKFATAGMPLDRKLVAMLCEDTVHRTKRRGCGYTQATRWLAARINEHRSPDTFEDLRLFEAWCEDTTLRWLARALDLGLGDTWRGWDIMPPERQAGTVGEPADDHAEHIALVAERQGILRAMPQHVSLEESRLLAGLIRDIILPVDGSAHGLVEVPAWPQKLAVGSCPLAEKCFLELAHGFIPRKARCNVLVDSENRPILVEKLGMGDDHSCISIEPVVLNGVRIPPGSLLAVHYEDDAIIGDSAFGALPGQRIAVERCRGFRMLRLTTLAVSPVNRARTFTSHFDAQLAGGLFEPKFTELKDLRGIAQSSVGDYMQPMESYRIGNGHPY